MMNSHKLCDKLRKLSDEANKAANVHGHYLAWNATQEIVKLAKVAAKSGSNTQEINIPEILSHMEPLFPETFKRIAHIEDRDGKIASVVRELLELEGFTFIDADTSVVFSITW